MKVIRPAACAACFAILLVLVTGAAQAQAAAVTSFKNELPPKMYGTYAPAGNCSREPRVIVDESGLAYIWQGKTTHSVYIVLAASWGGPQYSGISTWFYPFPEGNEDDGDIFLTFNPDERPGTLGFTAQTGSDWSKLRSLTPLQAALVRHSPYAKCRGHIPPVDARYVPLAPTPQLKIGDRVNKPTVTQMAAIHHAMGSSMRCFQPDPFCYSLRVVDLNGDDRPDLVVQFASPYQSGPPPRYSVAVMATAHGYANGVIELPTSYVRILTSKHQGMRDLKGGPGNRVFKWNGKEYY